MWEDIWWAGKETKDLGRNKEEHKKEDHKSTYFLLIGTIHYILTVHNFITDSETLAYFVQYMPQTVKKKFSLLVLNTLVY